MITWEPWDYTRGIDQPEYQLANIANGNFDAYIRSWAQGLASYDGTVLLRFAHEMNHQHYPWAIGVNGNTESDYIAAWRHIHDLFVAEGAVNVQWVWSPLIWWEGAPLIEPMYPGDAYVDWVALDGYNNVEWGGWQSFSQIFGASYQRLTEMTDKPIMIAEVASGEAGGSKAAWITEAFSQIQAQFPEIRAVVWFNESKETDWRVNSSNASLRAFRNAIAPSTYVGTVR
jgi:beta-mannanase